MMTFNNILRPPVGADLSRPPPIYRPGCLFRYEDYVVAVHYRPATGFPLSHINQHRKRLSICAWTIKLSSSQVLAMPDRLALPWPRPSLAREHPWPSVRATPSV